MREAWPYVTYMVVVFIFADCFKDFLVARRRRLTVKDQEAERWADEQVAWYQQMKEMPDAIFDVG